MDFKAREVIVTGGTGALGTAVVGSLLEHGARVHVPYTNAARVAAYAHRDRVDLVADCDLTRETDVQRLYGNVSNLWASIHVAGAFEMSPIQETTLTSLQRMFDVNLVTCFLCCREAARQFGARGGRIVNVAARPAVDARQGSGMVAYTTSKAAVSALTQALAAELGPRDVLVNAVAPAIIDTPANRAAMPDAKRERWTDPKAIAEAILFLASPENVVTSGAIVPVYGPG